MVKPDLSDKAPAVRQLVAQPNPLNDVAGRNLETHVHHFDATTSGSVSRCGGLDPVFLFKEKSRVGLAQRPPAVLKSQK